VSAETRTRVLTAVVGALLTVALLWAGGWWLAAGVAVLALVAQSELYALAVQGGFNVHARWGLAIGLLVSLQAVIPGADALLLAGVALYVAYLPFAPPDERLPAVIGLTLAGVLYPTALLTCIVRLRLELGGWGVEAAPFTTSHAFWLTFLVFFSVWASDTFAYYTGRRFGKRPLAPIVSPKKTWEGASGGATGAVLVGLAFYLFVFSRIGLDVHVLHVVVVSLIGGVVSPLGDLAESRIKRAVGAKDSGRVLPGHGGVLDRFDAIIVAAPLCYVYLRWALLGGGA
jgi:phosphatidate cytidylyltransferase